jgi:hypothetical protein
MKKKISIQTLWSLSPGINGIVRTSLSIEAATFSIVDVTKFRSKCKLLSASSLELESLKSNLKTLN